MIKILSSNKNPVSTKDQGGIGLPNFNSKIPYSFSKVKFQDEILKQISKAKLTPVFCVKEVTNA